MKIKNNGMWVVSEGGLYKRKVVLEPTDRAVGYVVKEGGKIKGFQTYFTVLKMFSYNLAIEKARKFGVLDEG